MALLGVFAQSIKAGVPIIVEPVFCFLFEKFKNLVDSIESLIKHTALHM